jgi:hypothetical protein
MALLSLVNERLVTVPAAFRSLGLVSAWRWLVDQDSKISAAGTVAEVFVEDRASWVAVNAPQNAGGTVAWVNNAIRYGDLPVLQVPVLSFC